MIWTSRVLGLASTAHGLDEQVYTTNYVRCSCKADYHTSLSVIATTWYCDASRYSIWKQRGSKQCDLHRILKTTYPIVAKTGHINQYAADWKLMPVEHNKESDD